jgi:serine/threonine-protein kinase
VVDFGLAKRGEMANMLKTAPRTRLGTPAYMSPEQAFGREVDARADLYSLGVLLYEMLTGYTPFSSDTMQGLFLEHFHTQPRSLSEVTPEAVPDPEIDTLLMALLNKEPQDRPESAAVVFSTIDAILGRLGWVQDATGIEVVRHPACPPPPPRVESFEMPAWQRSVTNRTIQIMAAVLIVATVIVVLWKVL